VLDLLRFPTQSTVHDNGAILNSSRDLSTAVDLMRSRTLSCESSMVPHFWLLQNSTGETVVMSSITTQGRIEIIRYIWAVSRYSVYTTYTYSRLREQREVCCLFCGCLTALQHNLDIFFDLITKTFVPIMISHRLLSSSYCILDCVLLLIIVIRAVCSHTHYFYITVSFSFCIMIASLMSL